MRTTIKKNGRKENTVRSKEEMSSLEDRVVEESKVDDPSECQQEKEENVEEEMGEVGSLEDGAGGK